MDGNVVNEFAQLSLDCIGKGMWDASTSIFTLPLDLSLDIDIEDGNFQLAFIESSDSSGYTLPSILIIDVTDNLAGFISLKNEVSLSLTEKTQAFCNRYL